MTKREIYEAIAKTKDGEIFPCIEVWDCNSCPRPIHRECYRESDDDRRVEIAKEWLARHPDDRKKRIELEAEIAELKAKLAFCTGAAEVRREEIQRLILQHQEDAKKIERLEGKLAAYESPRPEATH